MATIGDSSKPSGGWHAFTGNTQVQQEAELLTMPELGDVLQIGAWIGGWSGTCRAILCLWRLDGVLLGQTAQVTAANFGAGGPAGGNVNSFIGTLLTPVRLAAGQAFFVGFDRHGSDGHQISVGGPGSPSHYEGRHGGSGSTWPGNLGAAGGVATAVRRSGAWVANYVRVPGAKVMRSGVQTDAQAVQVLRSGAWTDVLGVQIMRSGAWVDSQ